MEASGLSFSCAPPPEGGIVRGDCVAVMSGWRAATIDVIYADPPYNASPGGVSLPNNKTGGAYRKIKEDWDVFNPAEYAAFTESWISKAAALLKPAGGMFIACSMHNIGEVVTAGKKAGLKLNNIITWRKTNAMPSIAKRTFTHTTEFTCWFVKGPGWTFNYEKIKRYNPQMSKSGERKQMPDFVELPVVQGGERIKRKGGGRALHPAQKPERLLEILLSATTAPGDFVMDPFMGAGTTAVVAERLRLRWCGVELNAEYADAAEARICAAKK